MTGIGILAGGGRLPLMIAESVAARGEKVHIVGIEGEADPAIARFPHTWVGWGQIGRMVEALRGEGRSDLVIAGAVKRPDLRKLRPDAGFFRSLPHILRLLAGGDDSVLTRVVRFFEGKGLRVRGAHEVAPDLLAAGGQIAGIPLSPQDLADARIGFGVRQALAAVDAGQAVAVAGGRVLAIEGAEGTDAMLERIAGLAANGAAPAAAAGRGVLAKGPKPGQELRVDMPAIGPRTIEKAVAAGLSAVVVEAGAVLVLDKAEMLHQADALGVAVHGLAADAARSAAPARRPSASMGRVIGRRRPGRRDVRDIERGLATVTGLAPFATGTGVVVVRAFVLAIEAGEGLPAMLERVQRLRQWGLRGEKKGVLVVRVDAPADDPGAPGALLRLAAAQQLAGVAVTGPALGPWEGAARLADSLGLALVVCEERP